MGRENAPRCADASRSVEGKCVIRHDEADQARVGKWFLRSEPVTAFSEERTSAIFDADPAIGRCKLGRLNFSCEPAHQNTPVIGPLRVNRGGA